MLKSRSVGIPSMFFKTLRYIIPGLMLLIVVFTACSSESETKELAAAIIIEVPIAIPCPESPVKLELVSDIPGMIRLIGYSGSDFVTGTVEVNNRDWIPEVEKSTGKVRLVQTAQIIPSDTNNLTNLWKLRVSDNEPFRFEIRNRQAEGHWNFSGLPITDLVAEMGDAKNAFTFDEPNPIVMKKCEFHCGAGDVSAEGILNAVCQNLLVQAGTGALTLRFTGKEILQNLQVSINAGTGAINLSVSPEIPARIIITSEGSVIAGEGFIKSGETGNKMYETAGYLKAPGKTIEILISGDSGIIYLNPPPL